MVLVRVENVKPTAMHPPAATYRLQFRNGMDFARAVELIPHLIQLGISHLYASPIFTAVRGSTHGYDVTDFNEIDPVLGGREGYVRLVSALKAQGLGIMLDIVPNHMAAHLENDWWHSVVEWGRSSEFAHHFDIDWREPLTLPFLGRPFEEEVAAGNVFLAFDRNRNCLALNYCDALYPLAPACYPAILKEPHPSLERIAAIASAAGSEGGATRFHSEIAAAIATPSVTSELDDYLRRLSADREHLCRLHEMQPWRLKDWRTARDHLSYRRFFEITGLVGMRVEDPAVFADTHRLVLDLVKESLADGLRIDHIDGLADPEAYLRRLRHETGNRTFIVVEKIMQANEALPADWPVNETTGYEFISALAELLTEEAPSSGLWNEAQRSAAEKAVAECKLLVLGHNLNAEVTRLAKLAARLGSGEDRPRIAEAIRHMIAALPVYRTYVSDRGASPRDSRTLDEIAAKASAAAPAVTAEIALVTAALKSKPGFADRRLQSEFRTRFQQLSGAAMAKGVEDTLFYRKGDYLAGNEVGANPCWRPAGTDCFHEMMRHRAENMPNGLSATSTHDTKRGEDARARLYVISEAPDVWAAAVARWHEMNVERIRKLPDGDAPEVSVEQFIYQSLLGTWPVEPLPNEQQLTLLRERMIGFAVKALREAKLRTSWDDPDERYEAAVTTFLGGLLKGRNRAFLADFEQAVRPFVRAGLVNSLSQTLVKLTAPGIPDIYQGSERLDLSLVDPDNRRSFSPRPAPPKLTKVPVTGDFEACKQALIGICLTYRREGGADLFAKGDYRPLSVEGPGSRHAAAFMRRSKDAFSVTVVPRLVFGQTEGDRLSVRPELWRNTFLVWPEDCGLKPLRNLLTEDIIESRPLLAVADILSGFPVAFLVEV
jgi:(1->4)-alpha-D-glucan 1-alpha-D-glucosylmutase